MRQSEKIQTLEALLATILVRAGGRITLPFDQVMRCRRSYRFYAEGDAEGGTITVGVQATRLKLFRPRSGRRRTRARDQQRNNSHPTR